MLVSVVCTKLVSFNMSSMLGRGYIGTIRRKIRFTSASTGPENNIEIRWDACRRQTDRRLNHPSWK